MTVPSCFKGSTLTPGSLGVTVRIGVFFDGTGNNRINSQIGADCRAVMRVDGNVHIKECGGRHSDPNSSYSNDLTNIAHLVGLYRQQLVARNDGQGLLTSQAIYISGVGTTSGGRDSIPGQGFGRGNTGVVAKVCKCVKKVQRVLGKFETHNPGCVIAALEFDVFGFSRGAASARHFVNEVLKQSKGALGPVLDRHTLPLATDFNWSNTCVRIKVIGLFDTVAAIGGISDLGSVKDDVNRRVNLFLPPGCAQQVIHLVAGDEHRRNFSLNSVAPAWAREIVVPGSHSDIGGGYHPYMVEKVALTRPRRSIVGIQTPYDATDAWLDTHQELGTLDAQRWIDPQDEDASLAVECVEFGGKMGKGLKRVVASVMLERRVFGHLSRVYLRVMHALACDEGVPFRPLPPLPEFTLSPDLRTVATKMLAYARGGENQLSGDEIQMLYRRYIHCSAHWNSTLSKRGPLIDGLFVHAPAREGRARFPNVGQPGYPH
jgi:hypothetical protein